MTLPTKSLVLVVLVLTAGCVGTSPIGDGSETATPASPADTATPTPDPNPGTEASATEVVTVNTEGASNEPDPDKAVRVENAWNQSAEIRITVVREATNETVHAGTYTLDPGEEREVYNVADADPDGIESFRVTVTARNTTDSVTVETHACHGDVSAALLEDGTVYASYPIC